MDVLRTPENRFLKLKEYPFQAHYLDLGGIRIHYIDEGIDNSGVILLLHGVPTWSYLYRKIVTPLADAGYRVIAPDLAGFGKSDKPTASEWHNLTNHTDLIAKLIRKLDLRNIILFGQDWGSMIGLRTVVLDQDRYSGIIISNGGLPAGSDKAPPLFVLWNLFTKFSPFLPIGSIMQAGCKTKLPAYVKRAYKAPFPKAAFKKSIRVLPQRVPSGKNHPDIKRNKEAWNNLKKCTIPFLTVFSDSDSITRGWDKKFQENVPGAKDQNHQLLKGGHFIQEDQGLALAKIIITFIMENNLITSR